MAKTGKAPEICDKQVNLFAFSVIFLLQKIHFGFRRVIVGADVPNSKLNPTVVSGPKF
jgi:hypothetical protein